MKTPDIKAIQTKIGTTADGVWGAKSEAACVKYLKSLCPNNPWPTQVGVPKFFGTAGNENNLINLNVEGLGVKYEGTPVKTIRCHKLVGDSLHRILKNISESEWAPILSTYSGCYNYRPMRGSSSISMHAYGIAVDLDPDNNSMRANWPIVANMPWGVIEIFAREGWKSLGAFNRFDAMHIQSTQ